MNDETSTYNDALTVIRRGQFDGSKQPKGSAPVIGLGAGTVPDPMQQQMSSEIHSGKKEQTQRESEFALRNVSPDATPLDTESGLSFGTRAKMSFESDPEKKAKWLSRQDGIDSVRFADDGKSIIARVKDNQGKPKDVLLDERGITAKDAADMVADLPSIAVGALIAYLTGGQSLLVQSAASAGGAALEGGLQDAATRSASGTGVDPGEITRRRGMEFVGGTLLPLVPGAAKRTAGTLLAPFAKGNVGPLEKEVVQAAERQGVPLTASQITGSPALGRVEMFTKNLPLGGALKEQQRAQEEAIRQVQRQLLGDVPIPREAEIQKAASEVVKGSKQAMMKEAEVASQGAVESSEQAIKDILSAKYPGEAITPTEAGKNLRSAVIAARDKFKAEADKLYGQVYQMADADKAFISGEPIKKLADEIKKSSPEATQQLLPEIKRIFKVGESLEGSKMTLRQAIELRSVIGDMLGRPEALPGIPEGYLKRLYGAASEAIEKGVKNAPNPEIGEALSKAQNFYKENFWKFEQPGIAEMFAETAPGKGFKVGDSKLGRQLVAGKGDIDLLNTYASVLGENSSEYQGVVRSALGELVDQARFGNQFVDADSFLLSLKSMSPEFRKKVLGSAEGDIVKASELMNVAKGAKIATSDLERILGSGEKNAVAKIKDAIAKQEVLDKTYSDRIRRELASDTLDVSRLNPDEFVSRFVDNSSVEEVMRAMIMIESLDKDTASAIQKRTMANLLDRAGGKMKPDDVVSGTMADLSYDKLAEAMKGDLGLKMQAILGSEGKETLKDLMTIEASRAKSREVGGAAGQLVYSNILAALMDFKLGEVPRIIKNRILASALTTPGLKTWMASQRVLPATPRIRYAVMASPPVIRSLMEEFANEPDKFGEIMDAIRGSPDAQAAREDADNFGKAKKVIQKPSAQPSPKSSPEE